MNEVAKESVIPQTHVHTRQKEKSKKGSRWLPKKKG